jgi:hypothetical protein
MEKDNIQREFFDLGTQKKQRNRFGQFFRRTDFSVNLSAEKLIFLSIGVLMLAVVCFALGVERGKSLIDAAVRAAPATVRAAVQQAGAVTDTQPKAAVQQTPAASATDKSKSFMIAVGVYSKEATAITEINKLKSNGLEAYMLRNGQYYAVCVGSFASKDSAQKTLAKVKQFRKDAYIKAKQP